MRKKKGAQNDNTFVAMLGNSYRIYFTGWISWCGLLYIMEALCYMEEIKMSFGLPAFRPLRCPDCGHDLKRIAVQGTNNVWYKVWQCKCTPTEQEIEQWNKEVILLPNERSDTPIAS